jgi:hypothetical protein
VKDLEIKHLYVWQKILFQYTEYIKVQVKYPSATKYIFSNCNEYRILVMTKLHKSISDAQTYRDSNLIPKREQTSQILTQVLTSFCITWDGRKRRPRRRASLHNLELLHGQESHLGVASYENRITNAKCITYLTSTWQHRQESAASDLSISNCRSRPARGSPNSQELFNLRLYLRIDLSSQ